MLTTNGRALCVLAAMIGLSGCGGNEPAQTGGQESIAIKDFDFGDPITITAGSLVTVTNVDAVGHTWTSSTDRFESGFLESGDSFDFVFEEPGEFAFFCEIHPSMTGSITITP